MILLRGLTLALLFCHLALPARADVKLAEVYADHMMLQHGRPLSIRGSADTGEKVTVKLAGQTVSTVADDKGRWQVTLAPLKASATPVEFTVSGRNTVVVKDVLVGDVWLCSGQSNMVYPLGKDTTAMEELPKADHPGIRLCQAGDRATRVPQADLDLTWRVCTPESARKFSGVGYFFGRDIHEQTDVPIGLICSAVSGTPAQSWLSLEAIQSDPAFKSYQDLYYANKNRPGPSNNPFMAVPGTPASLFNGMIAPLTGMQIKGVVWYQGESNDGDVERYRKLFPALIADWRKQWKQPNLPFLFVQLPPFGRRSPEPGPSGWAGIREAQAQTLALPHTGMAVSIDLGRQRNLLHPPNKREIGRRLALIARATVYGQNVDNAGPVYDSAKIQGNKVHVAFRNIDPGLSAGTPSPADTNQPAATPGLALKGFLIAGADRQFVRANAVIDDNAVVISSSKVSSPVAVRYGWEQNPEVNLYNKKGFPAAPFRTDAWPLKVAKETATEANNE